MATKNKAKKRAGKGVKVSKVSGGGKRKATRRGKQTTADTIAETTAMSAPTSADIPETRSDDDDAIDPDSDEDAFGADSYMDHDEYDDDDDDGA